ncbi:hypothetical protein JTB14_018720 [Gonioctena quinquepunctata]|nr:hypothetical protein JTB14_018720 [Gonioctena quinquepunctata]
MISSAGEQYTSSFEHPSHFGNEPYQSPPTHSQTHPPMGKPVWKLDRRSIDERLYYPERYETPPQVEQTPGDTSGAPAAFYQTCSQIPSPYSPKVVHMSSKSFAQVNDNPPESYSMTVDAPGGIDQQRSRYATQLVTFGDTPSPGSRRPFQPTFMSTPVTGDPYSSSMQEPNSDWYENFEEPPDSEPNSAAFFPSSDSANGYNHVVV